MTSENGPGLRDFIRNLPLDLHIRFKGESLTYQEYQAKKYSAKTSLETYEGQIGELYYGLRLVGQARLNENLELEIMSPGIRPLDDFLNEVMLDFRVDIGWVKMTLEATRSLGPGSIVELDTLLGEALGLYIQNVYFGIGETVVIEDNFGVRVCGLEAPSVHESSEGDSFFEKPPPWKEGKRQAQEPVLVFRVELGRSWLYRREAEMLGEGSIVELDALLDEHHLVYLDDVPVFLAEIVVIGDSFGVRIIRSVNEEIKREPLPEISPERPAQNSSGFLLEEPSGKEAASRKHFGRIREMETERLVALLQNEHPQAIALVLYHMEPKRGAQLLSLLPEKLKGDIDRRISELYGVEPEILEELDRALALAASQLEGSLESARTLELALERISWEDFLELPEAGMRKVIQVCDPLLLALALQGVDEIYLKKVMYISPFTASKTENKTGGEEIESARLYIRTQMAKVNELM